MSWKNVSDSLPACSTARRWRACAGDKTGYKIYDRYQVGRADRPEPAAVSACQPAPDAGREVIVALKKEYPRWGAPKIRARLRRRYPEP